MAYVSQGNHIIDDTVKENLSWGYTKDGKGIPNRIRTNRNTGTRLRARGFGFLHELSLRHTTAVATMMRRRQREFSNSTPCARVNYCYQRVV